MNLQIEELEMSENQNIIYFALEKISYNLVTLVGWMCFGGIFLSIFMINFVDVPAAMAMTGLMSLILSVFLIPIGYTLPKKEIFEFDTN